MKTLSATFVTITKMFLVSGLVLTAACHASQQEQKHNRGNSSSVHLHQSPIAQIMSNPSATNSTPEPTNNEPEPIVPPIGSAILARFGSSPAQYSAISLVRAKYKKQGGLKESHMELAVKMGYLDAVKEFIAIFPELEKTIGSYIHTACSSCNCNVACWLIGRKYSQSCCSRCPCVCFFWICC